jgi:hypothetical protein
MSSVLKKSKQSSVNDLLAALNKFMDLLEGQQEFDAVRDLKTICAALQKYKPEEEGFQSALKDLAEAYDGDHELRAYTLRRKRADDDWTEAEELYLASIEVLNLMNRLSKTEV